MKVASYSQRNGGQRGLVPRSPTGPCMVSEAFIPSGKDLLPRPPSPPKVSHLPGHKGTGRTLASLLGVLTCQSRK